MRESERGFTLVETAVTIGIVAVLLAAGGAWLLSMHPGALMHATADYDAALAGARGIAMTSGNGATLVFAPRSGGAPGFILRAYGGRPASAGAVKPSTVMPVESDATVAEATLGKPPFALFIGASGHVSGKAKYPSIDAAGNATFAPIANEPPCPAGGFVLTFTGPQGAVAQRTLPCTSSATAGGPRLPNPSPTPNVPLMTPALLVYHWPADAEQTFVATEWGYTHWFASTSGLACGQSVATFPDVLPKPYSAPYTAAEGRASPAPPANEPFSYPNSGGASMNDAPATFRLDPSAEGVCAPAVADDYGQVAEGAVQVMGWLTVAFAGKAYTHLSVPPLALRASTLQSKGAAVTLAVSKTYDAEALQPAVALDAACSPYVTVATASGTTPGTPSTRQAKASVTMTLVTQPKSKIACGGVIYDQYTNSQTGEGVPFNLVLGPLDDLDVEPGGLVYPSPGTKFVSGETVTLPDSSTIKVNGCPKINEPIAFPWLDQSAGTVNWKTPMTTAPSGSGLSINANGCDNGSGTYTIDSLPGDPSQGQSFPNTISAVEPAQTTGSFTYASRCGSAVSTPGWVDNVNSPPLNAAHMKIFSEVRTLACSVDIFDQGTDADRQRRAVTLGVAGACNEGSSCFLRYISSWTTWVSCVRGDPSE
ncbi:MAG TPA: prepilin-type N-terminal cleavage/methylation domain-containing protein, partial [Candidatus Acidoferrales bacterium]|nr:prepilin-type N-terminal cleavage/methylation domain-containing protein [Candidatus Acidoferrales bacterium]